MNLCVCGLGGGGGLFLIHISRCLLFWDVCGFYKEGVLCLVTKKVEENKIYKINWRLKIRIDLF